MRKKPTEDIKIDFFLIIPVALGLFLRLYRLDNLPAEIWGDVNEHFKLAKRILAGNLTFNFWGGDGPIFQYFVALVSKFLGLSFYTIKLTSAVFTFNFYYYFFIYPKTLPNKNTPFSKIIAAEIEKYPSNLPVFIIGCCWGEWGQPEPDSIRHRLKKEIYFFQADGNSGEFSCLGLKKELTRINEKRFLLVVDPREKEKVFLKGQNCIKKKKAYLIRKSGFDIGWVVEGEI